MTGDAIHTTAAVDPTGGARDWVAELREFVRDDRGGWAWLDEFVLPDHLDGEDDAAWTNRIHVLGRNMGRYRQCSIGWHDECSDRGDGDCTCPCHRLPDTQRVVMALRYFTLAAERAVTLADAAAAVLTLIRAETTDHVAYRAALGALGAALGGRP